MSDQIKEKQREEEYWKLYTFHFPSGNQVFGARVLSRSEDAWVVVVTDIPKRKGKIIAECELEYRRYGFVFVTSYDHYGHLDLCRWIRRKGIPGNYTRYLNAVEEGWSEKDIKGIRYRTEISFVLYETNATREDWEITLTLNDEGKELVYNL